MPPSLASTASWNQFQNILIESMPCWNWLIEPGRFSPILYHFFFWLYTQQVSVVLATVDYSFTISCTFNVKEYIFPSLSFLFLFHFHNFHFLCTGTEPNRTEQKDRKYSRMFRRLLLIAFFNIFLIYFLTVALFHILYSYTRAHHTHIHSHS